MYQTIIVEKEKDVSIIRLNRPDKLNSFNVTMHQELQCAIDDVSDDNAVRCLLITGTGKGFCAGQDLADRTVNAEQNQTDLGLSLDKYYNPLIKRLVNLRVPVVCALNGVAAGAGASLVMACDIVVAARSASFVLSFSKVGLVPDSGSSWHFARAIGLPKAKAMAMLAEKFTAEQAVQWGLIYQVVDDEQLMPRAEELAKYLACQPTESLIRTRELIHTAFEYSLDEQLEREKNAMYYFGKSDNYQEGISAFIEKREAKFK